MTIKTLLTTTTVQGDINISAWKDDEEILRERFCIDGWNERTGRSDGVYDVLRFLQANKILNKRVKYIFPCADGSVTFELDMKKGA